MDHEKINYDLIVAVLEYIVVGEHEVCWTALSLNYSSLFYSSSLANKYFLGPAFLEHKINNFLNRYQRRAPVSEIFHSLLVCFATDTVTEHVASIDTRESQVTFNSHHLI